MTGQRQSAARQQTVSSGSFQFKYFHFNSNIFNYNSPDEFICVDNGGKSCCVVCLKRRPAGWVWDKKLGS